MYFIPSAALIGYDRLVESYGYDSKELMLSAGINPEVLHTPDIKIPGQNVIDLLENTASRLNQRHFGIQLATIQDASILGTLWFLIKNATTLESAINTLVNNFSSHANATIYSIDSIDDGIYFHFDVHPSIKGECTQIIELSLALCCLTVRRCACENWTPVAIYFRSSQPKEMQLLNNIFGSNIFFGQEFDGAFLNADDLKLPFREATQLQRIHFQNELDKEHDLTPISTILRVENIINASLTKHQCTLNYIANSLDMKPRTLQHHLKRNGTTFNEIYKNAKLRLALRYLRNSELTITQVAERLLFSDLSLFTRFIKQSTGQSPTQIRNNSSDS